MEWIRESYFLTNEPPANAVEDTYSLLQLTYWAHKRPKEVVAKVLKTSLCFYLLDGSDQDANEQVGFGRVITDFTTTSWVSDVVLREEVQNQGLGSWMMKCMMEHPELAATQFILQTGTAHKFYERLGFGHNDSLMSTQVDYL